MNTERANNLNNCTNKYGGTYSGSRKTKYNNDNKSHRVSIVQKKVQQEKTQTTHQEKSTDTKQWWMIKNQQNLDEHNTLNLNEFATNSQDTHQKDPEQMENFPLSEVSISNKNSKIRSRFPEESRFSHLSIIEQIEQLSIDQDKKNFLSGTPHDNRFRNAQVIDQSFDSWIRNNKFDYMVPILPYNSEEECIQYLQNTVKQVITNSDKWYTVTEDQKKN